MNHAHFIVPPGTKIRLKDYKPGFTSHYKDKEEASAKLRKDIKRLAKYQDMLSKGEQKRRLLARIDTPEKNWKFSLADSKERGYWDDYRNAFEDTFNHTSTEHAPWYIVPADNKWFTRTVVADVIVEKLKSLQLRYPVVSEEHRRHLLEAKELLENG